MMHLTTNYARLYMMLEDILEMTTLIYRFRHARTKHRRQRILKEARKYNVLNKIPDQLKHLHCLVNRIATITDGSGSRVALGHLTAHTLMCWDVVSRPHGLKVPQGCYYLCDNPYANSNGREMVVDPIEAELDGDMNIATPDEQFIGLDYVECVEPTLELTATRDNLALYMWNNR
ncbi:hypothetical protein AAHA92_29256 [Salvia divinorum]|uniref:Uncharacterized protein n=1 Tax=Salvia divinorum TaxID=28513 RepID=A0ABD1FXS9_SALDI